MFRTGALISVLAMTMAACSGGGPSVEYADFDQALSQAKCQRAARCGLFPDEDSCNANARVVPDTSLAAAIAAKAVKYDGQQAKQCIDATAKQGCDSTGADVHLPPDACVKMLTGTVAGGGNCSINAVCASGTCVLPTECPEPSQGCCVGACRPTQAPAAAGGSCVQDYDCQTGLVCGADATCHKPGAEGDDCGSDPECGDGLGCIGATPDQTGICRTLPHIGEECPYLRCAEINLRCDGTSHTCVAYGLPGDTCPTGSECAPNLECNAMTKMCELLPQLGAACDDECGGDSFCQFGANDAPPGVCVAPYPNTQPCDGFNQCATFYCEQGPLSDFCKDAPVCF
jgi:hypothetical protein